MTSDVPPPPPLPTDAVGAPPLPRSGGDSAAPPAPPTTPAEEPTTAATEASAAAPLSFACPGCGSQLHYAPGTTTLKCPSCGAVQQIDEHGRKIEEHSYDDWAKLPEKKVASIGKQVLKCQGCGATTETDMISDTCQFCGGVLVALQEAPGLIVPEAVVPFGIDNKGANGEFGKWVKSRWFAPNALKKVGSTEALKGTYVPHWTYDAETQTDYTGERGEHYYTTETFSVSDGKGGSRMETRQVQHTRWYPASGHVAEPFDDVLVVGSHTLPSDKLNKMGPWTLQKAAAFDPQYLAGYTTLRYDVDPDTGLGVAKSEMEAAIRVSCANDIGGDEQRVSTIAVQYSALMFKLMLLPLWIASYIYAGKTYQVLINANTGEVVGDRPYSKLKITLAVIGAIVIIAAAIAIYVASKHSGNSTS